MYAAVQDEAFCSVSLLGYGSPIGPKSLDIGLGSDTVPP